MELATKDSRVGVSPAKQTRPGNELHGKVKLLLLQLV